MTVEEAFLHVSRTKMDRPYRSILKILPDTIALKFSGSLLNRSLMQFEAQNRFLAKWGKSLESFLMSPVFNQMSIEDKEIMISGFLETGALYECIVGELDGDKVVFYEEGLIQKSLMFLSTQNQESVDWASLTTYLEHIPLPHLVVYVRAATPLCYKRMLQRPRGFTGRLRKYEPRPLMSFLEKGDEHLEKIVSWLKENSKVYLIEVYNDGELGTILKSLCSEINQCYSEKLTDHRFSN
jgi:hypothetical protein